MEIKKSSNLEIRILPDFESLSRYAAEIFILESARVENIFTVSLSGGDTPKRMYELLGSEFEDKINWRKVHIFWGDEREEKESAESNFYTAFDYWLGRTARDVPGFENNIHRVKMELGLEKGANQYEKELIEWIPDGFDMAINGVGADGHRNGVMPELPGVKWKNEIWDLPKEVRVFGYQVPAEINAHTKRITLTPWFLNKSRVNILLLSGAEKAQLLKKITIDRKKYNKKNLPAVTFNETSTIVLSDVAAASEIL